MCVCVCVSVCSRGRLQINMCPKRDGFAFIEKGKEEKNAEKRSLADTLCFVFCMSTMSLHFH